MRLRMRMDIRNYRNIDKKGFERILFVWGGLQNKKPRLCDDTVVFVFKPVIIPCGILECKQGN